ncbi:RNA12 protein-domain-containing protein [Sporodiniella umbellata]|nr:RNA12 protein-domain-containing protein [Sporodiniella umbellata]
MSSWDIRQLVFRNSEAFLKARVKQAIPSKDLPHHFEVKDILARTKDGGAIVKFSYSSTEETKAVVAKELVDRIQGYIQKSSLVAPFNFQQLRTFLVKGQPFLEDLLARYPTQRLRIEFQGDPVHIERLYEQLRPYGKIFDISLHPNPNVGKDPSRYAIVQFKRIRSATSARNCLHGYTVDGTRLNVLYERQMRTNVFKEWLMSHPRITIPIAAAMFAGVTYAVFDPIRAFFITSKVTHRFNPDEYAIYRWLRKETWDRLISSKRRRHTEESAWASDFEQTERLGSWLTETPGKGITVRYKIYIDCGKIANARNQSEITKNLAKEVGYFPLFTWIASMNGFIDTMIMATTGQKAGFSTTPSSQIKDVLESVALALRDMVNPISQTEQGSRNEEWIEKTKKLISEKAQKAITLQKDENEGKILDQKSIPVVVIDNFMCRETVKNAFLWDELSEWAALLIENNIAHVVFVSSNASVMKYLGKALPGKTFASLALSDSPQEKSLAFVKKQLGEDIDDPNLDKVVSALGGRFTELELLIQKMKMNMDAESAFEDIVARNLTEIRKCGFGDISAKDNKLDWTPIQFWTILKLLHSSPSVNYDELKWGSIFNGCDLPIKAMERAELITVVHKNGRPNSIKPGKPIHYVVFGRILSDTVFASSMEIDTNMYLKKQAEENMAKLEDTIEKLSNISQPNRPPREVETRIRYLLAKLSALQQTIEVHDTAIKTAKEIVSKDWLESE